MSQRASKDILWTAQIGGVDMDNVLDLVYNRLDEEAKAIFVDIATVCANQPKHSMLGAWISIHGTRAPDWFDLLLKASLITVVQKDSELVDIIEIHDVLRDLGRKKVVGFSHIWSMQTYELMCSEVCCN